MKDKLKNSIDNSNYKKLYIYIGIIAIVLVLSLFVFSKTASQKNTHNNVATTVEPVQLTQVQEQLPTPTEPKVEQEQPATVPVTQPVEQTPVVKVPEEQVVAKEQEPKEKLDMPTVAGAEQYASVPVTKVVIKKGQTLTTIFKQEKLKIGDLYSMLGASKVIERVSENDEILYQVKDGKVVTLHLRRKNGQDVGTYVYDGKKYSYVPHP